MPRLGSTSLSVALAGVITLAAYVGPGLVAAAVLLVQVLIAVAPGPLDAMGRTIVSPRFVPALAAGGVAMMLTLEPELLSGADDGAAADVVGGFGAGLLAGILPAVAVAVFAGLVAQMLRQDGRNNLVQSTAYAVTLAVLAALVVGWIGATQSLGGAAVVAVGAAGVVGGLIVWMVPIDRLLCLSLATLAGGAAGAGVIVSIDSIMTVYFGVVVGSGTALLAVVGQVIARMMTRGHEDTGAAWGFPGAMPIAFAAPIVYIGGQLITASRF